MRLGIDHNVSPREDIAKYGPGRGHNAIPEDDYQANNHVQSLLKKASSPKLNCANSSDDSLLMRTRSNIFRSSWVPQLLPCKLVCRMLWSTNIASSIRSSELDI